MARQIALDEMTDRLYRLITDHQWSEEERRELVAAHDAIVGVAEGMDDMDDGEGKRDG